MNKEKNTISSIPTSLGTVTYKIWGEGFKILFAFHGFGQNKEFLRAFTSDLNQYKVISIDLFFHGESKFKPSDIQNQTISQEQWGLFFGEIVSFFSVTKFSVLGFSMGGRWALEFAFHRHNQIEKLFLLAPDAVYNNPFMLLFTRYKWGKSFLEWGKNKPSISLKILDLAFTIGVLKEKVKKYYQDLWSSPDYRNRIFNSWTYFTNAGSKTHLFLKTVQKNQVIIFLAENDSIVPFKKVKKKVNRYKNVKLVPVVASHKNIVEKSISLINDAFKH